ncbi:SMP-30/gluconolactonase/LRE family protein [Aggregatilinea lenta]|uniref:SMP-30/gluconolactonase/LRE family protein n=1 Tax=Aggregatilinea lenta TaxID=913108 RepID=UPI000E5BB641|nr:SMP-30/gluconolactonase/LRE family protein [Aggregatilinea lenta]
MQISKILRMLPLAGLVIALVGVPGALAQGGEAPEQVVVEHAGLFPEGIEWDAARGQFLLGSIAEGTIFSVQDDGTIAPFIENDQLMASIGLHIDPAADRLLVANNNPAVFQGPVTDGPVATLMAFDLESGEELFYADFSDLVEGGQHFANDVTVDADGNAYVTDSFAPVIFKVTPDGTPSVFLEDEQFAGEGFNLNGIEYHPDGYLIVAKSSTGQLFKVPVDSPEDAGEVMLDTPVNGADGIVLRDDGTLFVVGSPQSVFAVQSTDGWESASVASTAQVDDQPTTAALRDGEAYVIFAKLSQQGSDPLPETFEIVHVPFEDLETMSSMMTPEADMAMTEAVPMDMATEVAPMEAAATEAAG